jgi:AcrR family transcriptional regulator
MSDAEFDAALIEAAFALAAERGWSEVSVAAAARLAGLPLDRARQRFPGRAAILLRFGLIADQQAVAEVAAGAPVREALFDMIMRRLDAFQPHRAGLLALFRALPGEPGTALLLAAATQRSMDWLLEAAGVPASGPLGGLRARGLTLVWLWTLRAWRGDESADLSATMAALDRALGRAEQASEWLPPPPRPPAKPPDATFMTPV